MNHTDSTLKIALLILVLCIGPASAEQPQPQPLTGAYDPETLLLQLEQLVKNRDWKTYGTYLSPGFRFIPYASLWVEYPTMEWDLWGQWRELDFIQELVAPNHRSSLNLLDNVLDRGLESHGRAEWDLVYTLVSLEMVFQSRATLSSRKWTTSGICGNGSTPPLRVTPKRGRTCKPPVPCGKPSGDDYFERTRPWAASC